MEDVGGDTVRKDEPRAERDWAGEERARARNEQKKVPLAEWWRRRERCARALATVEEEDKDKEGQGSEGK